MDVSFFQISCFEIWGYARGIFLVFEWGFWFLLYFLIIVIIVYFCLWADCIKTLTSPSGNISSPGFPWLYHPHVYCDWIVTVAKGQRVTVQVLTFDIPPMVGERCIYGYLEYGWFSSENNRMVEVGHRCGHQDLQKFTSPDNRCWIHFVGGSSYPHNFSQSGFFLKFETTIETESPISSAEGIIIIYQSNIIIEV